MVTRRIYAAVSVVSLIAAGGTAFSMPDDSIVAMTDAWPACTREWQPRQRAAPGGAAVSAARPHASIACACPGSDARSSARSGAG
ncbi:MAG: hypothetical protein H7Y61_20220 [Rhizobiales bacterium]|nr:hypothetical protein [Rhizobacter sp.]